VCGPSRNVVIACSMYPRSIRCRQYRVRLTGIWWVAEWYGRRLHCPVGGIRVRDALISTKSWRAAHHWWSKNCVLAF